MRQILRAPDVHALLPPILACLPTAFLSPHPPPALLPLLSPILRQRLRIHTSAAVDPSAQQSSSANWLPLLTWSPKHAQQLVEIVLRLQLEPHPVSGEIELFAEGDEPRIQYRRLDSETLQSRCGVPQYELAVVWTWCTNDTGGVGLETSASTEAQDGWKVAEVLPFDCNDEDGVGSHSTRWTDSLDEAEEAASTISSLRTGNNLQIPSLGSKTATSEEDDNGDYWAMYDRTPGRTPGVPSPAPGRPSPGPGRFGRPNGFPIHRTDSGDERAYFAQYGEVQPAMDNHDPEEQLSMQQLEPPFSHQQAQDHSESTPRMNGNSHDYEYNHKPMEDSLHGLGLGIPQIAETAKGSTPFANGGLANTDGPRIHSPTPSHGSSGSSPVAQLEASASSASAAEIGVKQHISTEMKSLWRLAKAAGIDRGEFDRVIRTELDVLSLVDELSGDESR